MGILGSILLAPITGPAHGFVSILNTLREQAESQMPNEQSMRSELVTLNARLEAGEIDEAEFQAREAELLAQLRAIRAEQQAAAAAANDEGEDDDEAEDEPP